MADKQLLSLALQQRLLFLESIVLKPLYSNPSLHVLAKKSKFFWLAASKDSLAWAMHDSIESGGTFHLNKVWGGNCFLRPVYLDTLISYGTFSFILGIGILGMEFCVSWLKFSSFWAIRRAME